MAVFEKILSEFKNGIRIRRKCWSAEEYIKTQNNKVFLSNSEQLKTLSCESLLADDWEIYQEHIDWNNIIRNKCPCWFWDNDITFKVIGTLQKINEDSSYKRRCGGDWTNCRPIRKEEIIFYKEEETNNEDRKDE